MRLFVTLPAVVAFALGGAAAADTGHDWQFVSRDTKGTNVAVSGSSYIAKGDYASALFRFRHAQGDNQYAITANCRAGTILVEPVNQVSPGARLNYAVVRQAGYVTPVARSVGTDIVARLCEGGASSPPWFLTPGITLSMPVPANFQNSVAQR
jgi:hypothetical protein